jgi:hypothetical protein
VLVAPPKVYTASEAVLIFFVVVAAYELPPTTYLMVPDTIFPERMAQFWKKTGGTRISLMGFNEIAGQSKRMMKDGKVDFLQ